MEDPSMTLVHISMVRPVRGGFEILWRFEQSRSKDILLSDRSLPVVYGIIKCEDGRWLR
jgi:hypothetical protein